MDVQKMKAALAVKLKERVEQQIKEDEKKR